ncbi:MAG: KpsF/GutQ family sugar-phosphate isomerase [Armatimonadetes bacterium]|nr:KpsF/GutQ family sugar-phosphate isomerase [Armatimonadota bacterium]
MILDTVREALRQEGVAVLKAADALGEPYETAVRWILGCSGRVITCGVGKSGHIARKTAGTLSSTGTPSLFLHAAEAVHGDLGMVTSRDIVILYSHSGETDELIKLFPSLQTIGAKTILITGRANSSGARLADLTLDTFVTDEACPNNLAPTTSTTVMLALSDALAIAVMKERRFGSEDFARFHPSGTLGKRLLLRVMDVMRKDADIALCGPQTPILDALRAITKAGAGAACVVDSEGRLAGLFSDGDLRRHILSGSDPKTAIAAELMTPNPATVSPDLLAVEALEVFQNLPKKIGEMPVLDRDGKVLGLIVLKDLTRSGIV